MPIIPIKETNDYIGKDVTLNGWVHVRRDHGKIIFIDLRDRSGIVQCVFSNDTPNEVYEKAKELRGEWVVRLTGTVKERPKSMHNLDIATGKIEIESHGLEVLSQAKTPPFEIEGDGYDVGEEVRMKYRYLDLRRKRMKNNLIVRHTIIKNIRDFLSEKGFLEIETPILTKSTPEGARDYLVPSRHQPGNFYALPQSPQQYKQLLMVGGVEKYFQIARCFRDEDTRGDRQPEFTQLDVEMSFADEEDVMKLNEELLIHLVKTNLPNKHISAIPFPRLTYKEAMDTYGTDRPDLRKNKEDPDELAFVWVIDFPFFEKTDSGKWTFTHNPFSAPQGDMSGEVENILARQYDITLNGLEIGGGSIRQNDIDQLQKTFKIMGYDEKTIQEQFGHMIEAFRYGVPPHGGIAWGLDRLVMLATNEPNIREVIAFPKTGDGRDLMMDSPSIADKEQLDELGISIKKTKKKK